MASKLGYPRTGGKQKIRTLKWMKQKAHIFSWKITKPSLPSKVVCKSRRVCLFCFHFARNGVANILEKNVLFLNQSVMGCYLLGDVTYLHGRKSFIGPLSEKWGLLLLVALRGGFINENFFLIVGVGLLVIILYVHRELGLWGPLAIYNTFST